VLENFSGTILLVSHDRYLIDRLATHIWELRDGKLNSFKGTYREFILRRATGLQASQVHKVLLPVRPMMRDNSKETRQRAQSLALVEERIREKELAIQQLSSELQRAGEKQAFERMQKLSWQVAQAQAALDSLMSEWEKLAA
jgi:ATP-binding cassette subfamily F protein 3